MKASASSAMTAFRSWSVVTTLKVSDAAVGELAVDEPGRDDAVAAARRKRRVGDGAHQPEPPPAVDQLDPAPGQLRPDRHGRVAIARVAPGAGSTRRRRQLRRSAISEPEPAQDRRHAPPPPSRWEIVFFSSADHSPSVRPPGGSAAARRGS